MKKNYIQKVQCLAIALVFSTIAFAQIITDGTYKILNTVHNEVMSVNTLPPGDPGNPDNLVVGRAQMATNNTNDDFQLWTFTHQGNDVYKIQNVGDSSFLGIKDGWCGVFGDVQTGFAMTSDYVEFKISAGSIANSYVFEIAFDAFCNFGSTNVPIKAFDIDGGNSGGKLQTFDVDTTNPNQQFQIVTAASLSVNEVAKSDFKAIYNQTQRTVAFNSVDSSENNLKIKVFDVNGSTLKMIENTSITNLQIDFNSMANGLYFIQIERGNSRDVKKVLIF
ncbi:T9SS type A sorting domain-containing protein [Kordia jejudonensis]|uniref:T9SS type A sorting domain-containing protein n=1 Tax=Kordia jejudonensis TaxID=1348245 RepID=UPI00062932F7|nr:T9SS type A sorting domain-containing protein [Kordia jejudonensis]